MPSSGHLRLLGAATLLTALVSVPLGGGTATADEVHRCRGEVATIVGTDGDDTIEGTPGPDVIVALKGSDVIDAGGGDDIVCTGISPQRSNEDTWIATDHVQGGPGNDIVVAGPGNKSVHGGRGRDRLVAHATHARLSGGPGDDVLRMGDEVLSGNLRGGNGDDVGYSGANGAAWWDTGGKHNGSDVFHGGIGRDFAIGFGRDGDRFLGGAGPDALGGGGGPDVIKGGAGSDYVVGHAGDDVLKGGKGRDFSLFGPAKEDGEDRSVRVNLSTGRARGVGHDRLGGIEDIETGAAADVLIGDHGPNHFNLRAETFDATGALTTAENDRVDGRGGRDSVSIDGVHCAGEFHSAPWCSGTPVDIDLGQGSAKAPDHPGYVGQLVDIEMAVGSFRVDRLAGSPRADYLIGGSGGDDGDVLLGRGGDDLLAVGRDDDRVRGGDGRDTVDFSERFWDGEADASAVTVDLAAGTATGAGNDDLEDIESVTGTRGPDRLMGDGGPNVLLGLGGNDYLAGRAGRDELDGGPGEDVLDGGSGDDACTTTAGDARLSC